MERYEASRGTVVRVREGHWKSQFAGMHGTIQKCWGNSEHATVDVLLEDGRSELFWLPNLEAVDVDIADQSFGLMHIVRERVDKQEQPKFPFGYYLDRDADLLILRRPDGSFVVAFNAVGADLFEVELAVWEDAD